jgi:predicted AAA+ superfamily ATPase
MIDRETDIRLVRTALRRSRVVALLGPRQRGKTTLARQLVPADSLNYFDLEDPAVHRVLWPRGKGDVGCRML